MTPELLLGYGTLITSLGAVIVSIIVALRQGRTNEKITEVVETAKTTEKNLNSKMDAALKDARALGLAEGQEAGRQIAKTEADADALKGLNAAPAADVRVVNADREPIPTKTT